MNLLSRLLTVLLSLTLLAGIGLIGYIVWSNTPDDAPGAAPAVEFRSVELGESVTVSVNVTGNHVTRAELWSEDRLLARELNPNPSLPGVWTVAWQWNPPLPGVYPLAARAFDEAGRYGGSALFPVVVPPRQRVVFSSNRSGEYSLFAMTPHSRETFSLGASFSQDRQPAASRAGLLAYASSSPAGWHILTRDLTGGARTDLTPDLANAQHPNWSADGEHLAFEVTDGEVTNLVTSDARGKNRVQVTSGEAYDGQASFSPSGDRLAFAGQSGGQWDIYTVDLDGQNLARLTNGDGQNWQPAWSPDGSRIAFASNRSGISQVYVMPADGSGEAVRLTSFPAGAEQPAWSPDGDWLAFVAYTGDAEGDNRRELYLLYVPKALPPVEGLGLIRLTQNSFDDTEPTWAQ